MVQVDAFWSYGLASGLTLAAGEKVRSEKEFWGNKYPVDILLWIGALFAPSGATFAYLCYRWRQPET